MAEQCSSFPTLTSTQSVQTQTVLTTFSDVVSTAPASTFSITTTASCGNSSCPPTVVQTESPGRTETTRVPVTLTSQIDTFVVSTFWGTSCTHSSSDQPSPTPTPTHTPTPPSPTTSNTPPPPSPTTSPTTSESPPQFVLSTSQVTSTSVMTLPNGIVTSEIIVVATTLEVPTATTTIIATQNGGLRTGRIVGAAVGGVVALSLLAVLIWYLRKKQMNIIFEKVAPPSQGWQRFDNVDSASFHQRLTESQHGAHLSSDQTSGSFSSSHLSTQQIQTSPDRWLQGADPFQRQYLDPNSSHYRQWSAEKRQSHGSTGYGKELAAGIAIPLEEMRRVGTPSSMSTSYTVTGYAVQSSAYPNFQSSRVS